MTRDSDYDVIRSAAISGEGSVLKSLCRYVVRWGNVQAANEETNVRVDRLNMSLGKAIERISVVEKGLGDFRETLGGVEAQVHELREAVGNRIDGVGERVEAAEDELRRLHHRIGVEETRTSRSITDWAAAGYPLLLERAEKAEERVRIVMAQRDAYEQALEDARNLITDRL